MMVLSTRVSGKGVPEHTKSLAPAGHQAFIADMGTSQITWQGP